MIKRLMVLVTATLALSLIAIGFFLPRDKPAPRPVVQDPGYEAAIIPPDSLAPARPRRSVEAPASPSAETAASADTGADASAADQAQPLIDSAEPQPEAAPSEGAAPSAMADAAPEADSAEDAALTAMPDAAPEADRKAQQEVATATAEPSAATAPEAPSTTPDPATEPERTADTSPDAQTATATTEPPAAEQETAAPVIHTVRRGDSLSSIAKQYYGSSASWKRIRDANRKTLGKDLRQMSVGKKLIIPPPR